MEYQAFLSALRELSANVLTVGALGAELRLRLDGRDADPRIREALNAVVTIVHPTLFDDLTAGQMEGALALLSYNLREALEIVGEPARAPGWAYTDPTILQQRGRSSGALPTVIASIALEYPPLARILDRESAFLDVGTGVGWIAIEAAKRWPAMRVTGLDIWEPSLTIAEANIAAEGVHDRVTLRNQNITELADAAAFDLIWLPSPFLPRELIDAIIPRLYHALKPDGVLIFGMFRAAQGAYGQAVTDLLTIRSGGYPWRPVETCDYLRSHGFADVIISASQSTGAQELILGRRPGTTP